MAGIRSKNTNYPYVFRYPEWEPYVFYPAGSVVSQQNGNTDSEMVYWDFWVAAYDVDPNEPQPDKNLKWKRIFDTSAVTSDSDFDTWKSTVDSDIEALYNADSDHADDHDSDIAQVRHDFAAADSDLLANVGSALLDLDSEILARKSADSDLWYAIDNLRIEYDSDNIIIRSEHDSDLLQTYHDFEAADSDLIADLTADIDSDISQLKHDLEAQDSDNTVKFTQVDSDITQTLHDALAADSDQFANVDSDIQKIYHDYKAADSDFRVEYDSDIPKLYHDYQAADSDLLAYVSGDIDSDIQQLKHDLAAHDSDNTVQFANVDSDLAQLRHDTFAADSDAFKNIDSDLRDIVHDYLAEDSDIQTLIAQTVHNYLANDSEYDSEIRRVEHDFRAADSDIVNNFVGDIDSDIQKIYHDYKAADSDFRVEYDSDIPQLYHDYKAADSDLLVTVLNNNTALDSEILERKSADSDIAVSVNKVEHDYQAADSDLRRDVDSDLTVLENISTIIDSDLRVLREADSDLLVQILDIDSDLAVVTHDYKAADSDIINKLVSDIDSDLAKVIHDSKAGDSDIYANIDSDVRDIIHDYLANDSDINTLIVQTVHNYLANDSEIDSDTLQNKHDIAALDSDLTHFITSTNTALDSDLDSEILARKSADSDIYAHFDSEIFNLHLNDLRDVDVSYRPEAGTILAWDSDSEVWKAQDLTVTASGATYQIVQNVVATQGQVSFKLNNFPAGDVMVIRNGITLPSGCVTVNGKDVTYYPVNNDSDVLDSDDEIKLVYNRSTNIAFTANLNDLNDVDTNTTPPVQGDTLIWDSDNGVFAPGLIDTAVIDRRIDSEIHGRIAADSDFRVEYDSDLLQTYHDFRGADSDLLVTILNNNSALDSEIHDRKAADSDLQAQINNLKIEFDSDNQITRTDHDSDLLQTYHDFRGADSDLLVTILNNNSALDSEILERKGADSDILVLLAKEEHDRLAADSDFRVEYDSDIPQLYHDYQAADSDIINTLVKDIDSDIQTIYHDYKAADSDIRANLDSEVRDIMHDYLANDSDINTLIVQTVHNYLANDSETDSELVRVEHDSKARDSDILASIDVQLTNFVSTKSSFYGKAVGSISKGDVVMFAGAQGDHLLFTQADTTVPGFRDEYIIGVADSDLANNDFGYAVTAGSVVGIDTSPFTEGSLLYLSPEHAGVLIDSEPTSPLHSILVAATTRQHATQGSIYVRPTFRFHLNGLHDVLTTNVANGEVLTWDSDRQVWSNVDLQGLLFGDIAAVDSDLRHDVDSDLTNRTLNGLADVSIDYAPVKGTILAWDSDSEVWTAQDLTVTASGATWQKVQIEFATQDQTVFNLRHTPAGEVNIFRNGIALPSGTVTVNGTTVTYYPTLNDSDAIDSDDEIRLVYNRATNVAFSADLNDLTDVNTSSGPREGQTLVWDSDNQVFVPSTYSVDELNAKVAMLEADRDSDTLVIQSLQMQINDLDSDNRTSGKFFVQPTAPTGYANSGWVNTSNMKLYAWDTVNQIWVEVTTV